MLGYPVRMLERGREEATISLLLSVPALLPQGVTPVRRAPRVQVRPALVHPGS